MNMEDLESYMVYSIINTNVPYPKVKQIYDILVKKELNTRQGLQQITLEDLSKLLKENGYRFPNQKAKYLKDFANSEVDLATTTREELCEIRGVGMKLASMFLNWTRKTEYAILDVHIKRWLLEQGLGSTNYLEAEKNFIAEAEKMGMTPTELDTVIWETYRKKRRKS